MICQCPLCGRPTHSRVKIACAGCYPAVRWRPSARHPWKKSLPPLRDEDQGEGVPRAGDG